MQQRVDTLPKEYPQVLPYFAKRFTPLLLLILVVVGIYYSVDMTHERRQNALKESGRVDLAVSNLETSISGVIAELRYLADSTLLQRYFASGSEEARLAAQAELMTFARHVGRYEQLRWLDLQGIERLRVDYHNGNAQAVPKGQLQDKSQRYYFRESISLRPGAVYVTPMDLNVEHGEVEFPHRPMIRFATPTRDEAGVRNGLMVLNYEASILLNDFARLDEGASSVLQLLNQDGFWLYHPEKERTFSFMFGGAESFAADFPQAWQAIRGHNEGQLQTDNGLFTFASLSMKKIAQAGGPGEGLGGEWGSSGEQQNDWLVVISHRPVRLKEQLEQSHMLFYGLALVMLLLLSGIIVWRLSRAQWEKELLQERLELHARVMETATNGVVITDAEQRIVSVNRGFCELTGYSADEVVGQPPNVLASGRHDQAFYDEMWRTLLQKGRWEGEIWNRHKNGELFPEWLSISAIKDHHGRISNFIGLFSVLSEQKSTESRLRELANSDPLTGLINRNLLYDRAAQALSQCRRNKCEAAFLFVDLDGFKPINDRLGHAAGDMVLRQVANRLQQCVRESDTVARFGGDEFVLVLQEITGREAVAEVAQKILDVIASDITVSGEHCRVGASIGISLYPGDGDSIETVLNAADQAMYKAKAAGRHRYIFAADS